MTLAHQLDLVRARPTVDRGAPLVACRLVVAPVPWARPKPYLMGLPGKQVIVQRFVGAYAGWRTKSIRELARWWSGKAPLRQWLVADVRSVFARPPKAPTVTVAGEIMRYPWPWEPGRMWSVGQGDVDNLAKGVLDVLQQAPTPRGLGEQQLTSVLVDDRLVVDLRSTRWYAAEGESPCMEVRLWVA